MKKILLMISVSTPMFASITYDFKYNRIYSYPLSNDIDQEQYRRLFMQLVERIESYLGNDYEKEVIANDISDYLQVLGTPTALRLLKDISCGGFYPQHIRWSLYGIISRDLLIQLLHNSGWDKELHKAGCDKKAIDDYVDTIRQVGAIIITCWNSGVYGLKVQNQIVSYLKKKNTEMALGILAAISN